LSQGVGRGGQLFEHNKGLAAHLGRLHCNDVDDLTELREQGVERPLQL
jgi:hypothetical protein